MVGRTCITAAAALLAASLPHDLAAQGRSLTLGEAVALAQRAHPSIVQAQGQLTNAGAGKREAVGNWLPTFSVNSAWSTNSSQRFDPNTQRTVSGASTSYSAGFSASLELFDGFRRAAQNRSASADASSADAALVNQRFQVTLETKEAFFSALAADELVRVAETRIQRTAEQLKIAIDKLAAGSAIRSDTLRSYVELANARLQRLNAEVQRTTAEANLARLVGVEGTVRAVADSGLFTTVGVDTAQLWTEALAQSPSLLEAEANARAARAALTATRAQYFPSVAASYNNSWSGPALDALGNSWSARVSFNWNLFNGFTREANVARSAAGLDLARAQAADARRQIAAEFTQFLAALNTARTRIDIAGASKTAAGEDVRIQQERYRLGAATIVEVLTAQVNLDQAEVDEVQARFDYLVAKAQIEALIGREL